MRLLLDTHVFLWWRAAREMRAEAMEAIRSADDVFVSAASAWEVSIKAATGKIRLTASFADGVAQSGFVPLPINLVHAAVAGELPPHDRDPFDRSARGAGARETLHTARTTAGSNPTGAANLLGVAGCSSYLSFGSANLAICMSIDLGSISPATPSRRPTPACPRPVRPHVAIRPRPRPHVIGPSPSPETDCTFHCQACPRHLPGEPAGAACSASPSC